jgi:peroxiredoxin (alkyl hydroperoxide reductase subunit C)
VAISTDSVYSHKVFHDISPHAGQVQYPLLSDRSGSIARAYGVWSAAMGAAYRATFIVDPKGRIRYYSVYPREVGRNVRELVRTLAGIQYGEATGEGVPAGWKPGMPGIRRDFDLVGTI